MFVDPNEPLVDFFNGNFITRPNKLSKRKYDFDIRRKGDIWHYVNSADKISDFDIQVKESITNGGEFRIVEEKTLEIVKTNEVM